MEYGYTETHNQKMATLKLELEKQPKNDFHSLSWKRKKAKIEEFITKE